MFNPRTILLLGIALILALASVFVAEQWVESIHQPPKGIETEPVVVAATQIEHLSKIKATDVKILHFPKEGLVVDPSLPKGGLKFFSEPSEVIGKFVTQTVYPNEPIVAERLRENFGGSGLSHLVSPGMRAVTVRVDDVTGVAGFVLPGNRVDLLTTRKLPNSEVSLTELILQNVKVLAVDQQVSQDKDLPLNAKTVTMELTPSDAGRIVEFAETGALQMTLRNPLDKSPITALLSRPVRPDSPPTLPPTPVAAKPVARGFSRTISLGGRVENYWCTNAGCMAENRLGMVENSGLPPPVEPEPSRREDRPDVSWGQ